MTAALHIGLGEYAEFATPSGAGTVPVYRGSRVIGHEWVNYDSICADLAPHATRHLVAKGLRPSTDDDHRTEIFDTDPDWLCQGALTAAARRVMGRRA